jgi:hypothetical protein
MIKNRRLGRFLIQKDLIDKRSGEILEMFSTLKILVVRAEALYAQDAIEYVGISPVFDEVESNLMVPTYYIKAETDLQTPGAYKYTLSKE